MAKTETTGAGRTGEPVRKAQYAEALMKALEATGADSVAIADARRLAEGLRKKETAEADGRTVPA